MIHPGQGDIEQSLGCLQKLDYKGLLVENMPKMGVNGIPCIGYSAEQIKRYLEKGFGFCLDFGHAYNTAASLGTDAKKLIKKFMELEPAMFHVCGGHVESELDEHLSLGEGNFDFKFIKECVQESENKMITFETLKKDGLKGDIKNFEYFRGL